MTDKDLIYINPLLIVSPSNSEMQAKIINQARNLSVDEITIDLIETLYKGTVDGTVLWHRDEGEETNKLFYTASCKLDNSLNSYTVTIGTYSFPEPSDFDPSDIKLKIRTVIGLCTIFNLDIPDLDKAERLDETLLSLWNSVAKQREKIIKNKDKVNLLGPLLALKQIVN